MGSGRAALRWLRRKKGLKTKQEKNKKQEKRLRRVQFRRRRRRQEPEQAITQGEVGEEVWWWREAMGQGKRGGWWAIVEIAVGKGKPKGWWECWQRVTKAEW